MPKLNDTHLIILATAAKREGGSLLPLPKTLKVTKAAATGALKSLLKQGIAEERPATEAEEVWREEKDGTRHAMAITAAGLEAIGMAPEEAKPSEAPKPKAAKKERQPRTPQEPAETAAPGANDKVRSGTKLAALVDLLSRKQGGTLAEAMATTGWQSHSVRGAISGALKKKLGLAVTSEPVEGRGRVYRIAPEA